MVAYTDIAKGGSTKRLSYSAVKIVLVLFFLSACAVAPKHPALKNNQLPDLIPLRHFFLNKETKFGYKVSPDGKNSDGSLLRIEDLRCTCRPSAKKR